MNTHTNAASGYTFRGGNALILTQAMQAMGWQSPLWMTPAQAKAQGKTPLPGEEPVQVVLNERPFKVFNLAQLAEAMQDVTPRGGAIANRQPEDDTPTPEELECMAENAARETAQELHQEEVHLDMAEEIGIAQAEAWDAEQQRLADIHQTPSLIVRPDFLRAAAMFASREEYREYLRAVLVRVRNDKVEYVATDGHRLAILHHPLQQSAVFPNDWHNQTHGAQFLISTDELAKLPTIKKKAELAEHFTAISWEQGETFAQLVTLDGRMVPLRVVDAEYPDVDRVFPQGKPDNMGGVPVGINVKYLADIQRLVNAAPVSPEKSARVSMTLHTETAAILFESQTEEGYGMRALVMPLRV